MTWVRFWHQDRLRMLVVRSFREVLLYRHCSGVYLAQDPESETLIPNPSRKPYYLVFISKSAYMPLCEEARRERLPVLIEAVKPFVEEMPGFCFDGERLIVPS